MFQSRHRSREARTTVMVPCRMGRDGRWGDACVHNVSSRGMLVAADDPPKPGSYIELRRGTLIVIGRVVWCQGRFFGIRSQDRLSVDALVNEPRRRTRPEPGEPTEDRRSQQRLAAEGARARTVEQSRHFAAAMQYAVLVIAVVGAAWMIFLVLHGMLSGLATSLTEALATKPG